MDQPLEAAHDVGDLNTPGLPESTRHCNKHAESVPLQEQAEEQSVESLQTKMTTYCDSQYTENNGIAQQHLNTEGRTEKDFVNGSLLVESLYLDALKTEIDQPQISCPCLDPTRVETKYLLKELALRQDGEKIATINVELHPVPLPIADQVDRLSHIQLKAEDDARPGEQNSHEIESSSSRTFRYLVEFKEKMGVNSHEGRVEEPVLESFVHLLEENDIIEKECPICTEHYDAGHHKQSLLNCRHTFCDNCIKTIMDKAGQADIGRVKCPICRQKTPILKWEIRKLQEQMMDKDSNVCHHQVYIPTSEPIRRPGLCGALEFRFHQRFQTRMLPFPPCLRYPICFINCMRALEGQCHFLYLCMLVILFLVESMCFLLLLLPIFVLVLFILLFN
ncbi:ring finger protein-like [Bombina bombina]|uniref:ring finger protein-like n=1 Tax=Bombina bombina TaxID=8345 RepID=UPI00235AFAFA|nr:ring finger protein-like [Bombina bombina]